MRNSFQKNYYIRLFAIFCAINLACLFTPIFAKDIVVGTTSGYAPYVSLNEQGEYVGFDIDFARALAKKLDRTLVIKDLGSMPSLLLALKQGKIDAIIWAISITEERQKQMEMIYYQGEKVTSMPLLFWKEIPKNNSSLQELANDPTAIVCTEAGSFQESVLQKAPGIRLKQVDKVMDAILEIKYGKSRATMIDPSLASGFLSQFKEIKVLDIPLSTTDQSLGNGIALSKSSTELSKAIRQCVSELQDDGTIQQLEKKWNLSS